MTCLFGTLFEREHDSARSRLCRITNRASVRHFYHYQQYDRPTDRSDQEKGEKEIGNSETNRNSARKYSNFQRIRHERCLSMLKMQISTEYYADTDRRYGYSIG